MFKDNGRLTPADKSELANIKGKAMYCSKCDAYYTIVNAEFAEINCENCGGRLSDAHMHTAKKATGKK
jgi:PHP family Zn ribbon phosphoesterase